MINDDAELIKRTLAGDAQAFAELVEKYQEQIHALAWQKIGDFHTAQEITQDTFITAYQELSTLTHHNRFAGWLYVITSNKCKMWHRKKRPQLQSLEETDPKELEEAYYSEHVSRQREEASIQKRRAIVRELLDKLRESERTVVTMHYFAGLTCEEIAKFLGVSPNTVKSRLHRARERLKKEEAVIQENLSSFQLPTQLKENIMNEISRINPVAPSGSKPLVPLAISAASAILVVLLIGFGAQNLLSFQKPYSLESTSERTIEIVESQIVLESPIKPAINNQVGRSDVNGQNNGIGQRPNETPITDAQADNDISSQKRVWRETNGPVGGEVANLFTAENGDIFAGTRSGIYKLTDDGTGWNLINSRDIFSHREQMSGMRSGPLVEKDGILYLATDKEILSSADRGKTWETLSVHPGGGLIGLEILDQTFYLCLTDEFHLSGDNGVYRSDDNGASWVRLTPFDKKYPNIEPRAIAVVDNTVFVGTNKGLYRLNGNTWEQIFLDEIGKKSQYLPIISMEVTDNAIYVARNYHICNSFSSIQFKKPVDLTDISSVEVDLQEIRRVHLTEDSPVELRETPWALEREIDRARAATNLSWALFQSTDHGKTWKNITPRKNKTDRKELSIVNLFNGISQDKKDSKKKDTKPPHKSITYSPLKITVTANKMMLVDLKKHYHSSDSGETWNTVDTDALGNASAIVMANEDTYYRSGSYGIHRTTDGGKSWHQFNTGLVNTDVWQLIAVNGTLYANSLNGFVYSIDGGESWIPVNGDTGYITRIVESNGEIFVRDDTLGTPRFFRLSTKDNSLANISEIPVLEKIDPYKDPLQINRDVRNVGHGNGLFSESQLGGIAVDNGTYYVEYAYQLFRWQSGNMQWLNTGLLDRGVSVSEDRSFCYANNLFIDAVGFRFAVSDNTIYVGKKEGQLMQSLDGGLTWTDVTGNLPDPIDHYKAIAFAGDFVYVATDKGVVMSTNGTDWFTLTDAEGKPLIITMFGIEGTTVYGESKGCIYQVNDGMAMWTRVTPNIPYTITCMDVDGNTLYVGTRTKGVLRFPLDN